MIPKQVHFVFGLKAEPEPFHFAHYLAIESCRRVLEPETIYLHHRHLPHGAWWDRVSPHLRLIEVDLVSDVLTADYSGGDVPAEYRYAHHADFVRLDALIEHGGIYADIDTVFVRAFPNELFDQPFVIGREPPVPDRLTGEARPSLCNALLMAEPGALFARQWRERMAAALDGSWSNHSGFVSQALTEELPTAVHVEPKDTFFAFDATPAGLARLLYERHPIPSSALSVHLWAHLWWSRSRRDFSAAHAAWCTPSALRGARTTLGELARPYLAQRRGAIDGRSKPGESADAWHYLSLDESSGYGVAADRCIAALESIGVQVDWTPFIPGGAWGAGYQPLPCLDPFAAADAPLADDRVVIAHLVPEFLPLVRERAPASFLVGHTAWETDKVPDHWIDSLDRADMLVVPSEFSARAMSSAPISTPVVVVPHVAPALRAATSSIWEDIPAGVFVFYTVAEWNERKAVFKTIEAYLRAFGRRDAVLLVIKTSRLDRRLTAAPPSSILHSGTTAWALAKLLASHRDPPAISLVTSELSEDDLGALHRRGDCFVSLCRSEGWGLGAFDAAAYGNPVVTTGFGGHLDYLAGSPYLVDFDVVGVDDPAGAPSYAPDQHWAEPDIDHAAALLRVVLADREEALTGARSLGREIRWRYRPEAVGEKFVSAVARQRELASVGTAGAARPRGES